jgi:hypothetical protein
MEETDARSDMNDDREQIVQPVRVLGIVARVEQPKLEREDDTVGELDVTADVLLVLEPLEMESEDVGEGLDLHPVGSKGRYVLRQMKLEDGSEVSQGGGKGVTSFRLLGESSSCRSS